MVIAKFLILYPFLPQAEFYIKQLSMDEDDFGRLLHWEERSRRSDGDEMPDENMLRIDSIGILVEIVDGADESALDRGAWRRPDTSTPDMGGNTVITGHRFKYLPPRNLTFYHLDKLEEGDEVIVYWKGIEYDYKVGEIFEVHPDRVDIEENTGDSRLTLYTCTPLWTAAKRLVVVAELEDEK